MRCTVARTRKLTPAVQLVEGLEELFVQFWIESGSIVPHEVPESSPQGAAPNSTQAASRCDVYFHTFRIRLSQGYAHQALVGLYLG